MPLPSALSIQQFLDNYSTYSNYCSFAGQWIQSVNAIGKALQADPNFSTALTLDEQQAVLANISGSSTTPIIPINPKPGPLPPPIPPTPTSI
jgi:hypothetical protein